MESGRATAPDACTRTDRRAGRAAAVKAARGRAVAHAAATMAAADGLCWQMCNDGGRQVPLLLPQPSPSC